MNTPTWQEKFEYDFCTKKFHGMTQESITDEACKYFIAFIEHELELCRNETIEDCCEIIPWLGEDVDEEVSRLLTSLKSK